MSEPSANGGPDAAGTPNDPTAPREAVAGPQPSDTPETLADGGTATGAGPLPEPDPRVAELTNLVVHLKADFDNYKKRVQKEAAIAVRTGELESVKKFLPALANLERALVAARDESGALADGLRAVSVQFQGILTQMGVERVPATGQPFDPAIHEAVAATASAEVPPGTVMDEFEPGYRADGRALMPAKVRVSTAE